MPVRVPLHFVRPAMKLAGSITDGEGRVVAGAGTQLREGIVRVLRRMAVQSVLVVDAGEVQPFETVRPLADEMRDLAARFPSGAGEPLAELRAAIARHLTARAARFASDPETSSS